MPSLHKPPGLAQIMYKKRYVDNAGTRKDTF